MGFDIGIDLGTANTRTAFYRNDRFEVIPHEGQPRMPSFVAFTKAGRLIGQAAKNQARTNPKNTIFNALRFVGLPFYDSKVAVLAKMLPFTVTHDGAMPKRKRKCVFEVMYKDVLTKFTPVQILVMIIKRAKKDAEEYFGEKVESAVITIPSSFNLSQHYAIHDAASIAGINTLRLVRTPAVALVDLMLPVKNISGERNVLVCDIGAGYYSVALASVSEEIITVTTAADAGIGVGDDHDIRLMDHMVKLLEASMKTQININGAADKSRLLCRLRTACEKVKHQLSSAKDSTIVIEKLHHEMDFKISITREEFEGLVHDLIQCLYEPIERVLRDAKLSKSLVSDIFLIGGSSRTPKIQKAISDFFNDQTLVRCINCEEASSRGAALQASLISGGPNSIIPATRLLKDMVYKPLILQTASGRMLNFITRGSPALSTRRELFSTSEDNQDSCEVTFYEGDQTWITTNLKLGHLQLPVSPVPKGLPQLEVKLEVDPNYTIKATIRETTVGTVSSVTLNGYNAGSFDRLSQAMLQRVAMYEQQMQTKDDLEEARIETRNTFEELVHIIKGWIDSLSPTLRSDDIASLEAMADSFLDWLDSNQSATVEECKNRLQLLQIPKGGIHKKRLQFLQIRKDTILRDQIACEGSYTKVKLEGGRKAQEGSEVYSKSDDMLRKQATVKSEHQPPHEKDQCLETGSLKTTPNEVVSGLDRVEVSPGEALKYVPQSIKSRSPNSNPTETQGVEMQTPARSDTPSTVKGMTSLFARLHEDKPTYTDTELVQISTYLKNTGQPSWSKRPRLYTVLRLIDQLDMLDVFIQQGINDIWFPFTQTTLPHALSPSARVNFLKHQEAVLSKSLLFEKSPRRKHARFLQGEPLPYEVVGRLGVGAHGQVDKVLSTVSYREYARKLFRRKRGMAKDAISSFLVELQVLKRVQHFHCVELVQSYTDPKYFALIMSPVGDCNLLEYYPAALKDPDKRSLLRSFFGCLANALQYIHSIKIRHRDIKPHNILVKGDSVFLTDFGIALDWEELSRSTTTADSGKTWLYAAPEVAKYEKRNTAADVWSLGCVFMEMATVLKGQPISAMRKFFEEESGNYRFYTNISRLSSWADDCRQLGSAKDDVVFDWILLMLEEDPEKRPTAATLHHDISIECTKQGIPFSGMCCLENVDSSELDEDEDDAWTVGGEELTIVPGRVPEMAL